MAAITKNSLVLDFHGSSVSVPNAFIFTNMFYFRFR